MLGIHHELPIAVGQVKEAYQPAQTFPGVGWIWIEQPVQVGRGGAQVFAPERWRAAISSISSGLPC
jgi:hypothetical protein